jgi:hypothetical protein
MRRKKDKPIELPPVESLPPEVAWETKISEAVGKALQTFYPRMSTLDSYSQQLADVDRQVTRLVQRTVSQTTVSYWVTFVLYVMSFVIAIGLVGFGLYFTFLQKQNNMIDEASLNAVDFSIAGILCIAGGLITILVILNRNPLKNMRYLMSNMIKLNVVFSGYIRQIHQVDLVFKNLFVNKGDIATDELEEMFGYLQDAVDEAMSAISQTLNEIED